jgi:hypothetical protein
MRTFKGIAELSFKIVVPAQFIAQFREAAQAEDASEFLKLTQARHPENDEAFGQAIISNALRRVIRNSMAEELHQVGLGGTVSPVTMEMVGMAPDHDAPVAPQVVEVSRKADEAQSSDDPGGALAYIASNHTPPASRSVYHALAGKSIGGID